MTANKVFLTITLVLLAFCFDGSLAATTLFKPFQKYDWGGGNLLTAKVADVNGDGKLDIVAAGCRSGFGCIDGSDGIIGVLIGNGDGTFQPAKTYDSGGLPTFVLATADVNGDGKPDVIAAPGCPVGCPSNNLVSVLLGNGDGTFQTPKAVNIGANFVLGIAIADVNHDGKLDILLAENHCDDCGGIVAVLLGRGDGTFDAPVTYSSGGAAAFGVAVGDLNGDHKPDLVVGNGNGTDRIGILFGNGDGTFQNVVTHDGAGGDVAIADLNGDDHLDVIGLTCFNPPTCYKSGVGVLLGNGDGTFQALQNYYSGGYIAGRIVTGDINRDRKLDVLVANDCLTGSDCSVGDVGVLLGNGDGSLQKVRVSKSSTGNVSGLAIGDFNGDGKLDLLMATQNNSTNTGAVEIWLNTTFWATTTSLASSPNPSKSGQLVTLTASVTTTGWITPTGTVVFRNSGTVIGKVPLNNGVAVLQTTKLPVGTLSLTAKYLGDLNSAKSTSPVLIQVVNP